MINKIYNRYFDIIMFLTSVIVNSAIDDFIKNGCKMKRQISMVPIAIMIRFLITPIYAVEYVRTKIGKQGNVA